VLILGGGRKAAATTKKKMASFDFGVEGRREGRNMPRGEDALRQGTEANGQDCSRREREGNHKFGARQGKRKKKKQQASGGGRGRDELLLILGEKKRAVWRDEDVFARMEGRGLSCST